MIKTIPRKEIFEKYSKIKTFIADFQSSVYLQESGDECFDKWFDENKSQFDLLEEEYPDFGSRFFKIETESGDLKNFPKQFSKSLLQLFKSVNTEKLIVISEFNKDIFGWKNHPYYKVKKSYQQLIEILGKDDCNDAMVFDIKDFPKLFEIFFWLERCDPAIPEFLFWFDEKEKFCFTLCKHGNIHITEFTYRKTIKENILKNLNLNKFDGYCSEPFSETGAIKGRMINIEDD